MRTAVIEFNDQALLIKTEEGELFSEPGFALHTDQGIITGQEARQQAWLQPQNSYRDFWRQLNQAELPGDQRWARHHADIAFAQLQSLHGKAGAPEQLVLSVPGTFDDQQLSLLMGLTDALNSRIIAIVDSSLADCLALQNSSGDLQPADRQTLHIDLQLHQTVVSQIGYEQGNLQVKAHQVIPDMGSNLLYNSLANYIRDLSIDTHRYDPLHTSEGEQAIYDQLPNLIPRFAAAPECELNIASPRGDLQLLLRKKDIQNLLQNRIDSLNRLIEKTAVRDITFSHHARLIPALCSGFDSARELTLAQGVENCLRYRDYLLKRNGEESGELHRITSLKQTIVRSGRRSTDIAPAPAATHILHYGHAWPLNEPVSLRLDGKRLNISRLVDSSAALVISINDRNLTVIHRDNTIPMELPETTEAGEKLIIGDHQLLLIEVRHG